MGDPSERSAPVIVVAAADEASGVVPPDRRFATACPPLKAWLHTHPERLASDEPKQSSILSSHNPTNTSP